MLTVWTFHKFLKCHSHFPDFIYCTTTLLQSRLQISLVAMTAGGYQLATSTQYRSAKPIREYITQRFSESRRCQCTPFCGTFPYRVESSGWHCSNNKSEARQWRCPGSGRAGGLTDTIACHRAYTDGKNATGQDNKAEELPPRVLPVHTVTAPFPGSGGRQLMTAWQVQESQHL